MFINEVAPEVWEQIILFSTQHARKQLCLSHKLFYQLTQPILWYNPKFSGNLRPLSSDSLIQLTKPKSTSSFLPPGNHIKLLELAQLKWMWDDDDIKETIDVLLQYYHSTIFYIDGYSSFTSKQLGKLLDVLPVQQFTTQSIQCLNHYVSIHSCLSNNDCLKCYLIFWIYR